MNSYRPNNVSGRKGRRRLIAATVFVVVAFLVDGVSGGYIRGLIQSGAVSVWSAVAGAGQSIKGSGVLSTRRGLENENAVLRNELTEIRLRAAAFEFLKKENDELRAITRMVADTEGVTARIVSSFRASPYGTFLIGAGTSHGVKEGDLVMVGDSSTGFIVGRISRADADISIVRELFAPDASIEGVVNGVSILFDGHGGGQAQGDAPRGAEIKVGDPIVSPTDGGRAIGVVGKTEEDKSGASTKVFANLPVSMYDVRFVYVFTQ